MVKLAKISRVTSFALIAGAVSVLALGLVLALLFRYENAALQNSTKLELLRMENRISGELRATISVIEEIERFFRASQWVSADEFETMAFIRASNQGQNLHGSLGLAVGYLDKIPPAGEAYVQFRDGQVVQLTADQIAPRFMMDQAQLSILPGSPFQNLSQDISQQHTATFVLPGTRAGTGSNMISGAQAFAIIDLREIAALGATGTIAPQLAGLSLNHPTLPGPLSFQQAAPDSKIPLRVSTFVFEDIEISLSWLPEPGATLGKVVQHNIWILALVGLFSLLLIAQCASVGRSLDLSKVASRNAVAADRAKSRFLANMSHEIRTPLNGILGMSDLVSRGELSPAQKSQLATLNRSAESLLAIINGLLDFSKAEAGKIEVSTDTFDLADLVSDVLKAAQIVATGSKTRLFVDYPWDVPRLIHSDELRIRQIITNLINNAIKFTPGGCVTLGVRYRPSIEPDAQMMLELRVTDTGVGIAPDKIDKLFQPFVQADASTERNFGGTGLGLTIVSQLCELLGGEVSCVSSEGSGTTFTARIAFSPVEQAHPARRAVAAFSAHNVLIVAAEPIRQIQIRHAVSMGALAHSAETVEIALQKLQSAEEPYDLVVLEEELESPATLQQLREAQPAAEFSLLRLRSSLHANAARDAEPGTGVDGLLIEPLMPEHLALRARSLFGALRSMARPSGEVAPAPVAQKPSYDLEVLVVDDDQINRVYADTLLKGMGCRVSQLQNGKEAVEALLGQAQYDIIFMDCQMPVMDGLNATRHIRRAMDSEKIRSVPIIALTANAVAGDREECLNAGMDDYLSKPVREADFVRIFDTWCRPAVVKPAPPPVPKVQKPDAPPEPEPAPTPIAEPAPAPEPVAAPVPEPVAEPDNAPFVLKDPIREESAPSPVNAGEPLIDHDALEQTRQTLGAGFPALIDIFEEDGRAYLAELKEAAQDAHFKECVRLAHTLKSSGRMLGGAQFTAVAADLEQLAKDEPSTDELYELTVKLSGLHGQTLEQLRGIAAA